MLLDYRPIGSTKLSVREILKQTCAQQWLRVLALGVCVAGAGSAFDWLMLTAQGDHFEWVWQTSTRVTVAIATALVAVLAAEEPIVTGSIPLGRRIERIVALTIIYTQTACALSTIALWQSLRPVSAATAWSIWIVGLVLCTLYAASLAGLGRLRLARAVLLAVSVSVTVWLLRGVVGVMAWVAA